MFTYIISFSIGILLIYSSISLYRRYRKNYLKAYIVHIVSLNILAFLNFTYDYLQTNIEYTGNYPYSVLTIIKVFILIIAFTATFLNSISFFFFGRYILKQDVRKYLKLTIFIPAISIIVLIIFGFIELIYQNKIQFMIKSLLIVDYLASFTILIISIYIILNIKKNKNLDGRILIYNMGMIYLSTHIWFFLIAALRYIHSYLFIAFSGIYFLLLNSIGLKYMSHFVMKVEPQNCNNDIIENYLSKRKISKREKEVILLIYEGKSNKEIESKLFISIKTVKFHLYNIYKKLDIKSRIQLIHLIHEITKNIQS